MATTSQTHELVQFTLVLAEESPGKVKAHEIMEFLKLAREHGRLAETACNRVMTGRETNRESNIEQRMTAIAVSQWGLERISFGGDPRGATVKIHFKSKRHNTWGGEEAGYAVPGS